MFDFTRGTAMDLHSPRFPVLLYLGVWLIGLSVARADVISINPSLVNGFNGGNYAGDLTKLTDLSGMNVNSQPNDPSAWTAVSNSYPDEYSSRNGILDSSTTDHGKIGWLTFDLEGQHPLSQLYFWQLRNNNDARMRGFNLYFADSPLNIPAKPANHSQTIGDYAFSVANGWSQFGDDDANPLTPRFNLGNQGATPDPAQLVLDVSGVSASFIGIEILGNDGSTSRVGFAELAATSASVVPEPGTLGLVAGGMFTLRLLRRRVD